MRTSAILLAATVALVALVPPSYAQQPGYPQLSGPSFASGYGLFHGGGNPAGYAAPGAQVAYMAPAGAVPPGGPVGPGAVPGAMAPMPGQKPPQGCPGPGGCDPSQDDCTCRIVAWQFYGELLYLRPGNAEVPYAVPINGPIVPPPVNPVEVGPVALLDPGYEPGYRFGAYRAIDEWASIGGGFTRLETQTTGTATAGPGQALRALTIHPSVLNAAGDFLTAAARYNLNYQLGDVNYRCTFACGDCWTADYILGARYGHLEQSFLADYSSNGVQEVSTSINFDGGGPKLGIEAERRSPNNGLLVYGRGMASFLAGEFSANYLHTDAFGGTLVTTSWRGHRVVPLMELELGAGWISPGGLLRLSAGYMINAWFTVVKTTDFIEAVQNDNFNHLSNGITFDGFVARAEVRF